MLALRPTTGTFVLVAPPAAGRTFPAAGALARSMARIGAGRGLGAVATTLAVRSGLGNGPWDTLTLATHHLSGVGVGTISTALSAAFTGLAWWLGARPNPLLLAANAVAGGLAIDWLLPHVARATGPVAAGAYLAGAVAAAVAGATLVLGAPHARTAYDHALLGVVARCGWGLRGARWALDLPALGAGWALGGAVGPGTVVYAVLVGPLAQRAARRLAARRAR
jgi:uncharacterized membrane protein YczE